MLSTQSVRFKLVAAGLATVLLVGLILFVAGKHSFERYEHDQNILVRALEVEVAMLQVRREEKDFLLRDLSNARFYQTGESENLNQHQKAVANLQSAINALAVAIDETERQSIEKMRSQVTAYETSFNNLAQAYRTIGFRDTGLEVSWRSAILDAERRASQSRNLALLNQLLELRRNEKDYMLWRRSEDLAAHRNRLSRLRTTVSANAGGAPTAQNLLDYQNAFHQYLAMKNKIGSGENSGLQGAMRRAIHDIEPKVDKLVTDAVEDAAAAQKTAGISVLLGSLIGMAAGVVLFTLLANSIARPISQLQHAALEVRHGNLDTHIDIRSQDEIGVLARAFSEMTDSLQDTARMADKVAEGDLRVHVQPQSDKDVLGQSLKRMVENLQQIATTADKIAAGDLSVKVAPRSENDLFGVAFAYMVENLRRVLSNITEAVNVLSSSSTQIAASTSQVSAAAAETAAAVTETTATVEELRQTAQLSSQKARDVANMAQQSTQASLIGRQSVDEMVSGMERIREQMSHIGESVVQLSEQSQQIGDIINSVNDLAEQSNLLAVNAAIEAAKAGEQGKGFAVVAQEVKSLAEQSKQATTQVRSLLNEIQRATNAAVMAAEQGNKAVDNGLQQSVAAGRSIESLSQDIEEAALVATQIAASSQEQLVGVDQVALAMNNIKEASTQNVASMRQLESAATSLNDVGQDLKTLVQQYHVG